MPRYQLRNFPDVPFFYAAFSFALLPGEEKRRRKGGREDRTMERKGMEGGRDEDSEAWCGCYLVMHGSVIATIQPAYKRGSVSIPLADLRFIAPRWIADSQILRFALINDSY